MDGTQKAKPEFGTCSWNYDSWIGLVYSKKAPYSAAYLKEYCAKYPTVEVDSWFYKLPTPEDALEYKIQTNSAFSFACKLTESLSLTHERSRDREAPLKPNPTFLSADLYAQYMEGISALLPQVFQVELEFEYLNKQKMPSLAAFMKALESFVSELEKAGLRSRVPLAVECRNANYLKREYFQFLKDHDIGHVFSEKSFYRTFTNCTADFLISSATASRFGFSGETGKKSRTKRMAAGTKSSIRNPTFRKSRA